MKIMTGDKQASEGLDRDSWHRPLVSIIITHRNYSDFIRDAILSILDQTHPNWELVIADDASTPEHRERLAHILAGIDDRRISSVHLDENRGQVAAFYAGWELTSGDFTCCLDPDDRYAPTFLEEALAAHLNRSVSAAVVATDQYLASRNGLLSSSYFPDAEFYRAMKQGSIAPIGARSDQPFFIPSGRDGWHWTTTSALMFRRAVIEYLKPHRQPPFMGAFDSYAAHGAHLLGGTIFLPKPLIYRMIHENNRWHTNRFYSSFQRRDHERADNASELAHSFAREVLEQNGANIPPPRPRRRRGVFGRWQRSIAKRLPRFS